MAQYLTHTQSRHHITGEMEPLPQLVLATSRDGDDYLVTLTGDRVKELYRGTDQVKQQSVYREIKSHYEKRKREEA